MRSKASYFSISAPLLRENLRRFWAISLISFLTYFLSGPFTVLLHYSRITSVRSYLQDCLQNEHFFFMAAHMIFPIAAAVAVFRYLHSSGSVAIMNALPPDRSRMFNSSYLSGLLIAEVPMLLNGLIFLLLVTPVYNYEAVNVFTYGAVFNWMFTSFLIIAFIYTVSVFAGAVTGTTLYHFLGALLFNGVVPMLYLILIAFAQFYLWGFDDSGLHMELCAKFHPFSGVLIHGNGTFTVLQSLFYIVMILAVLVLSSFLYHKRKMEKVGDALTWRKLEPCITWLFAFLGMTLIGLYFYSMDNEEPMLYLGGFIGFLIFFFIGRMLVKKTLKVFRKESMKAFLACLLICALLVCGFAFDLTGYETRVPRLSSVEHATLSRLSLPIPWDSNIHYFYNGARDGIYFEDPENLEALVGLHQEIVDHREELDNDRLYGERTLTLSFDFQRKGLLNLDRTYTVPRSLLYKSENFKTLFESDEFKDLFTISHAEESIKDNYYDPRLTMSEMVITDPMHSYKGNARITVPSKMAELSACMDRDMRNMTAEDLAQQRQSLALIEITYEIKSAKGLNLSSDSVSYKEPDAGYYDAYSVLSYNVLPCCTETIQWLKDNGLWETVSLNPDKVLRADVYLYDAELQKYDSETGEHYYLDPKSGDRIYAGVTTEEFYEKFGYGYENLDLLLATIKGPGLTGPLPIDEYLDTSKAIQLGETAEERAALIQKCIDHATSYRTTTADRYYYVSIWYCTDVDETGQARFSNMHLYLPDVDFLGL
ncbi:MAG: hypothetical protein E7223_07290 [Clostridiales bacterium]|nr:hypothetical protein [Clostridiales bacterium]